jgi:hypothetical protein
MPVFLRDDELPKERVLVLKGLELVQDAVGHGTHTTI